MISTSSLLAGSPAAARAPDHDGHEILVHELYGRKVDGDLDVGGPLHGVGTGSPQDPFAQGHDQADLLGNRDEFGGRDQAALGMLPADQRLAAGDPSVLEVDERLVVELELPVGERHPQRELEGPPRLHPRVHFRLEKPVGAASIGFGAIKRHVGVLQQLGGVDPVTRRERDADAGVYDHGMTVKLAGRLHRLADPPRQDRGVVGLLDAGQDDGEFVAADPRHGIDLANAIAQARRNRLEQLVADLVPERVVDALEVVEIEVEHRQALVPRQLAERVCQAVAQQHAVGQIGQCVVARHVRDLLLGAATFGNVLMRGHPAAARHGMIQDRDGAAVGQLYQLAIGLALGDDSHQILDVAVRVIREHTVVPAMEQQLPQQAAGLDDLGRQSIHVLIAVVADHQPCRGIEHQQRLRHVVEGGVEPQVLGLQLFLALAQRRGSLFDQSLEAAIEPIQFLDHQRDRAIGPPPVMMRLVVGARDQLAEQLDVDTAAGLGGLRKLSGKEAIHEASPNSHVELSERYVQDSP